MSTSWCSVDWNGNWNRENSKPIPHNCLMISAILPPATHAHTCRLAEQRGELSKGIDQEQTEISKMADNLSSLQPTLENIRKATLPLQESLGLQLDKRRSENETAQLLPPWVWCLDSIGRCSKQNCLSPFTCRPLYVFFMQIRTYADVQGMYLFYVYMYLWNFAVWLKAYAHTHCTCGTLQDQGCQLFTCAIMCVPLFQIRPSLCQSLVKWTKPGRLRVPTPVNKVVCVYMSIETSYTCCHGFFHQMRRVEIQTTKLKNKERSPCC